MNPHQLVKITLAINYALQDEALKILHVLKTPYALIQSGRSAIIPSTRLITTKVKVKDEQQSIIECYVPYELELFYLQQLVDELSLLTPGRGSVWSQAVVLYTPLYLHDELDTSTLKRQVIEQLLSSDLQNLALVCPRDDANEFCRLLLSRGYPAPLVSYGMGMGTRSRMGLLRITIPPEKEVLRLAVHSKDSQFVLQLLAHHARVDLPGKGFLTHHPLRYAKINTKTHAHDPSRLASIEQIISAIDTLQGGIEWRRKNITPYAGSNVLRENKLIQLTFIGGRGMSEHITNMAFELGGRGATMARKSQQRFSDLLDDSDERHEREACSLALPTEIAHRLLEQTLEGTDWAQIGLYAIEEHEVYHSF